MSTTHQTFAMDAHAHISIWATAAVQDKVLQFDHRGGGRRLTFFDVIVGNVTRVGGGRWDDDSGRHPLIIGRTQTVEGTRVGIDDDGSPIVPTIAIRNAIEVNALRLAKVELWCWTLL